MSQEEYLLTSEDARVLLRVEGRATVEVSLDLNLTITEVDVSPEGLVLPSGPDIPRTALEEMARKRKRIFSLGEKEPEPLEIAGEHYYKLTPTSGAPTLEIDGIQMHRTSVIDPFEDSRQKIEGTVRAGDCVLDTCGGLGYTAIWAARTGASRVVSVEACDEVRRLRARNPWSRELHQQCIELVDRDILEHISALPDESFDSIIHDPPRFSLAGELYGSGFYSHLFRVLKPRGLMFHYTGVPYSHRGSRNFPAEVAARLKAAGFDARREPQKLGISARK
jgi:predicted methyltransferase